MELSIVTFEQAKALKDLGFPQDTYCDYFYDDNNIRRGTSKYINNMTGEITAWGSGVFPVQVVAPSLELAVKWLREEKEFFIFPTLSSPNMTEWTPDKIYSYDYSIGGKLRVPCTFCRSEYDDVLSAGIDRAIRYLKKK